MNIIVEGSRGKSGTVKLLVEALRESKQSAVGKITGKNAMILYEGKEIPIVRERGFLLDKENKKVLEKYSHCKFKIFENQALSYYTIRVVHNLIKPKIILIPNVRFEHQDTLGDTLEEQALSFAENFKGAKYVITTEEKKEVLDIFKTYCEKYNVELITIEEKEHIPSLQTLYLVEETIKLLLKKPLPKKLYETFYNKIKESLNINFSDSHKIHFFHGAKINDVESTIKIFEYLKDKTDKKFCFVCYFRKDRSARTEAFHEFFEKYLDHKKIDRFFFVGHYVGKYKIEPHKKIEFITEKDMKKIIAYCTKKDLVLFTAVNGVNDFMRTLEYKLTRKLKTII